MKKKVDDITFEAEILGFLFQIMGNVSVRAIEKVATRMLKKTWMSSG